MGAAWSFENLVGMRYHIDVEQLVLYKEDRLGGVDDHDRAGIYQ